MTNGPNTPDNAPSAAIKGWFLACATVTAIFFIFGFVRTAASAADGMTAGLVGAGLFLAVVHFFFIATFTAAPAALFVWFVSKTGVRNLMLFAGFGAVLGWLAQLLFNPLGEQPIQWLYLFSGAAAGCVYWFVTRTGTPCQAAQ